VAVFPLPDDRGSLTAAEVVAVPAGPERDKAIDNWCVSIWNAFRDSHQAVAGLLRELDYGHEEKYKVKCM